MRELYAPFGRTKDKIIEIATYIIVPLLFWVVSPCLGKFADSFYFNYCNIFSKLILVIILGSIIIAIGIILVFWTILLFKTKGQGTPNPKLPPKKLIIGGPYEYSRNPVALGGLLILLSESAIYHSPSLLGISIYVRRKYYNEPE